MTASPNGGKPKKPTTRKRPNKGVPLPPILKRKANQAKKTIAGNNTRKRTQRIVQSKYNWDYARETFITVDPPITLKQLALDLDIPYSYMRQRSSEERWQYLRAEEQKRIYKKKREDHLRKQADKSIRFDDASISAAEVGQTLVLARLSEIAQLHKAMSPAFRRTIENLTQGIPVAKEELYSAIRFTELKELALAAKLFQDMGRAAFGTDKEAIALPWGDDTSVENVISVASELGKDDPQRIAAMLEAFERAGMVTINLDENNVFIEGTFTEVTPEPGNGHKPMKEIEP